MSNSKPSKYACVVFYNDAELLENCLKSLKSHGLSIIAVDGAYADFPHELPYSTDGSVEVAKKYGKVIEAKEAWPTQVDKRNAYIKKVPIGSTFVVIDTDEELCSDIDYGNHNVLLVAVADGGIEYQAPRVFERTPRLRYYKTHMTLRDKDGLVDFKKFKKSNTVIKHYVEARDAQRIADKEKYRKIHNARELADREKLMGEISGSNR